MTVQDEGRTPRSDNKKLPWHTNNQAQIKAHFDEISTIDGIPQLIESQ